MIMIIIIVKKKQWKIHQQYCILEISIIYNVHEDDDIAQFCSVRSEHLIRHSGDIDLIVVSLENIVLLMVTMMIIETILMIMMIICYSDYDDFDDYPEHVIRHSGDIDLIVVALKKRYRSSLGDNDDDDDDDDRDDCDDFVDDSEHDNNQDMMMMIML